MTSSLRLPENSRVVQPKYIEKNTSKKDLVRRLRNLCQVLQNDPVEAESTEWPGLAAVADLLVRQFLNHSDKEVRLYTLVACVDILAIYAPEVPWDEPELLDFFHQMNVQLGNLAHTDPQNAVFQTYMHILDQVTHVKMGVILVELTEVNESAIDTLVELIQTLLDSLRNDHPNAVLEYVQASMVGCLGEFSTIPVVILDELLKSIAPGPTQWVLAPQAGPVRKNQKLPQIEVPNNTYIAAAFILRKLVNKIALHVSQLLTGLLHSESHYVEQSSISNSQVNDIIYELHRVAPQILTPIIGAVGGRLQSEITQDRLQVAKLLGRLFESGCIEQFSVCFREWLRRANDVDTDIRICIVQYCVSILKSNPNSETVEMVSETVQETLTDPALEVRTEAIRLIGEYAYQHEASAGLLQAVGNRVSAKQKNERKDAVTALGYIYNKQYLQQHVKIDGEDDLSAILLAIHETCHVDTRKRRDTGLDDVYSWIPTKILQCACFTDSTDTEMRSRVVQIVDEILVKKLNTTSKAIAINAVLGNLSANAVQFFTQMMEQRATLQKTVSHYVDARAEIRNHKAGTEAAIEADARAFELLETIAKLTAPADCKTSTEDVLQAFHGARDKHIFRILAMIADPTHSVKARARALDELPKRTKALGDAVADWTKTLVKRCAMGDSLNADLIGRCVQLAEECFREGDVPACGAMLTVVKMAADCFPIICGSSETFASLTELFSDCRAASGVIKKELSSRGVITVLSSVLSAAAVTKPDEGTDAETDKDELKAQLIQLCTRDGTPEHARNAVYTLSRLLQADSSIDSAQEFDALLQTLTSASRLKISSDKKDSLRIVSVLSALSALADCNAAAMVSSSRGDRAVKFAFETILLGRDSTEDEGRSDDAEESDVADGTPSSKSPRRSSSVTRTKHSTPDGKGSLLENTSLSVSCRRLCAAVDFLVSYVRSTIMANQLSKATSSETPDVALPEPSQVSHLFQLLTQIIIEQGSPPSSRDRKLCKSRQDRAALRQCAGVSLLRLCDSRLGLEKPYLSLSMWHTLGEVVLDEERVVREAMMMELADFLKGAGIYGRDQSKLPPKAPPLRFVALLALCSDGDRDYDAVNGSSANVGQAGSHIRASAFQCIKNLRKASDALYTQCCATGKEAEAKFDTSFKTQIMPEYMIPYAFHLLSHRRETPCPEDGPSVAPREEDEDMSDSDDSAIASRDGNKHRQLRKRLKLLFDPLVQSLGDGADNISFLLRMTEILGKRFTPVDAPNACSTALSLQEPVSISSTERSAKKPSGKSNGRRLQVLEAKLKTVCSAAREVLSSFIKKDVNLTPYPGVIQLPGSLFKRCEVRLTSRSEKSPAPRAEDQKSLTKQSKKRSKSPADRQSVRKVQSRKSALDDVEDAAPTERSSRVHFSPDVQFKQRSVEENFNDVSPMVEPKSPSLSAAPSSSSDKQTSSGDTFGATPPSALRTTSMRTTAPDASSDESLADNESVSRIKPHAHTFPTQESAPLDVKQLLDSPSTQDDVPSSKSTTQSNPSRNSGESPKVSRPRRGKRRGLPPAASKAVSPKKKQKKGLSPPKQIKVSKIAPMTSPLESSGIRRKKRVKSNQSADLDFDSGEEADSENRPFARNRSKASNDAGSSKKRAARPSRSLRMGR